MTLGVVVAEAAEHGLPVRLSVLTTNPALAFYRRRGFHITTRHLSGDT